MNRLILGDCLEKMKELPDESVDLVCTDPPYGYSFMNRDWDKVVMGVEYWKECLRVLKAGAFAFVMSAPRSDVQSQMVVNLQKAGFRVDFTPIYWCFGSGFPKASNIGKMVDKRGNRFMGGFIDQAIARAKEKGITMKELSMLFPSKTGGTTGWLWNKRKTQGITLEQFNKLVEFLDLEGYEILQEAKREIVGQKKAGLGSGKTYAFADNKTDGIVDITIPATDQAKALDGSYGGFQPKPAVEVVIVAMKPLSEKTYVDQALKNGKGITWLDSVRVPSSSSSDTFFDALLRVCDCVQDSVSPTTLCNKNYISRVLRVGEHDYSLDKEFHRLLFSSPYDAEKRETSKTEAQGSQYDCPACRSLYDELARVVQEDDQDAFPSLHDVHACIRQFALSHSNNQLHKYSDHLSNEDGLFRILLGTVLDSDLALEKGLLLYKQHTSNAKNKQVHSRFPANLLVSDDVLNDGEVKKTGNLNKVNTGIWNNCGERDGIGHTGDSGSFSRYFDLDRWAKEHQKWALTYPFAIIPKEAKSEKDRYVKCIHPTTKPYKLMCYLISLGSREGDLVLDPFCGSGTTCLSAKKMNRGYIGIEKDEEYFGIAKERVENEPDTLL